MGVFVSGLGAVDSVTVQSRVDRELVRLHFTERQYERAGDLLAEVAPRSYQASLKSVEGTLAKDEARSKVALRDPARYRVLLMQESISPQLVDTTEGTVHHYEDAVKTDAASIRLAKVNLTYCRVTAHRPVCSLLPHIHPVRRRNGRAKRCRRPFAFLGLSVVKGPGVRVVVAPG